MAAHTLFCDFASLNRKDAGDWVSNCSKLADEAFKNSSNQTRLLGNLLVLEQYMHTLEQGLQENGEEPLPITYQSIQMLWDYLDGKMKPSDFADFANSLYACVLEFVVGEELTEEQSAYYENHFPEGNDNLVQWEILCWASFLMLELLSIYGERLDFDEFESCDAVDFVEIDEMLNGLNDACIDFAGVECPSSYAKDVLKAIEDVYETSLFQSIVLQIQKALKDALDALPEDYAKLRKEYRHSAILPQEFASNFMEY